MKKQSQPLENVPELRQQISEAIKSSKLGQLKRDQKLIFMQSAIEWIIKFLGRTDFTKDQIDFMLATLVDQVPVDFPHLHKEEFRLAIKRGATGNYGEIYSFSPATIYSFIKNYLSEKKQILNQETGKDKHEETVTMAQRMQFIISGLAERKSPVLNDILSGKAFQS